MQVLIESSLLVMCNVLVAVNIMSGHSLYG